MALAASAGLQWGSKHGLINVSGHPVLCCDVKGPEVLISLRRRAVVTGQQRRDGRGRRSPDAQAHESAATDVARGVKG